MYMNDYVTERNKDKYVAGKRDTMLMTTISMRKMIFISMVNAITCKSGIFSFPHVCMVDIMVPASHLTSIRVLFHQRCVMQLCCKDVKSTLQKFVTVSTNTKLCSCARKMRYEDAPPKSVFIAQPLFGARDRSKVSATFRARDVHLY
jgi:hypothetical protein